MVFADLHTHTTNSDGSLTLATLPDAARDAGVEVVAVTDHDRTHPGLDGPITDLDGITVIHGIELRVEAPHERVDLLGYGVRETDALADLVSLLQRDRVERGRRIVENVESHLDVTLDVAIEPGVGRPHVARAIDAHPDTDLDYRGAFDELIGDDGPCFVARSVPDFVDGLSVLREACGLVGLAHPFRYEDPERALDLCADLDAVERYYPYDPPRDPTPVDRAVDEYDLVVTGGTDAHEHELGVAGLSRTQFEAFCAALDPPDSHR